MLTVLTNTSITLRKCLHTSNTKTTNQIKKYQKYKTETTIIKSFDTFVNIFDELYRKSLQDNVADKSEYENICNFFTKKLDERNEYFYHYEHKVKVFIVMIN